MFGRRQTLRAGVGLASLGIVASRARAQMPAAGKRDWAAQVPLIRIGLLGGENDSDRLGRYDTYAKLITETFGVPVRLFPAADYAGVI